MIRGDEEIYKEFIDDFLVVKEVKSEVWKEWRVNENVNNGEQQLTLI